MADFTNLAPTVEDAFAMGQTGGEPSESERLAFEAWMRGHCWLVEGTWNGITYDDRDPSYQSTGQGIPSVDTGAMYTRMLWAAWRDRAALSKPKPAKALAPE